VGGAERVVDVEVGVGCERLGEVGLVLGLGLVEADVLEDKELAWSVSEVCVRERGRGKEERQRA
jgi:hypothetical protein